GLGRGAWGRSVTELLGHLEHTYSVEQLLTKARELDRHYIPSRYPNVYESGYPGMYYDHETAERAIRCAEDIINWVRERLREIGVKT
ncbi:MAG: DNA-binding protein, partial [Thermoprotei archaeon]